MKSSSKNGFGFSSTRVSGQVWVSFPKRIWRGFGFGWSLILVGIGLVCGLNASPVSAQEPTSRPSLADSLIQEPLEQLAVEAQKFGDPARGAIAFYQPTMNCARCHEVGGNGRRLGPNLAEKREYQWSHLAESILRPSAKIKEGFSTAQVLLDDGKVVEGVLVDETAASLVIDQIELTDKPRVIPKSEIDDWALTKTSTMPIGLANQLNQRQQFLDLISYLAAIAEGGALAADELRPAQAVQTPLPEYESRIDHAGLIAQFLTGPEANEAFKRGQETYRLRCSSCHGTVQQEGSMPTSLRFASGQFKRGADPLSMYQTLTHGYGMMNPQRWMVPQQKYEVIHYIREHFLRPHNPTQFVRLDSAYLDRLPKGSTLGPKPTEFRPWTAMDYGPSLNNTIEVPQVGSKVARNIAQKGIVIRLDDGPGGVESGSHWMMYEHDTLRVAAAWQGGFIDFEGIHFNGAHQRHPRVTGDIAFQNRTGPGFARPIDGTSIADIKVEPTLESRFADDRVVGRDNKHYGPLPEDWARFDGLYRFGRQSILKYHVGSVEVLETPGLQFFGQEAIYTRHFEMGPRDQEVIVQIANTEGTATQTGHRITIVEPGNERKKEGINAVSNSSRDAPQIQGIQLDGHQYFQRSGAGFEMAKADFSIAARIKTRSDGTLIAKTRDQKAWVSQGKSLFIRGGIPTFDVGWVGAVSANQRVDDGKFHNVVLNWTNGQVQFFVDGKPAGRGKLQPQQTLDKSVLRIGRTNDNFPGKSQFKGVIADLRFYQRVLTQTEAADFSKIAKRGLLGRWNQRVGDRLEDRDASRADVAKPLQASMQLVTTRQVSSKQPGNVIAQVIGLPKASWSFEAGALRLRIPPGDAAQFVIAQVGTSRVELPDEALAIIDQIKPRVLKPLTAGGPANYPETLTTKVIPGEQSGAFAVDVFQRPQQNPWNCRMRLTGVDFMPDPNVAVVSAWDGSVWMVTGVAGKSSIRWRRFAYGLFQPLGVKVVRGIPYVICRDQLVALHDLNQDGEADWYQNFNSDHQVTEHFHEFAAGLQTDDESNFYYAKCARHAKPAIVPQHGTILKVSADGKSTEILANGFRAANGVCLNDDGSFFVTDQEGHWTPKNRINHVRQGRFYGNMLGYHDGIDESDAAMEEPLCWITNAFDRSPSELMWVTSEQWKPLQGSLLNMSYGYGQIYVVPHEQVNGRMQGGMVKLPLERFPTGIMRGRFHPEDGQLYCCGMFAWAGNQQQPGGFYRVRYTGKPLYVPTEMHVTSARVELRLTEPVNRDLAEDPANYKVEVWDLKRAARYGSDHHRQRTLKIDGVELSDDGQTIRLNLPDLAPTRGLKIMYSLEGLDGAPAKGELHGSILELGETLNREPVK